MYISPWIKNIIGIRAPAHYLTWAFAQYARNTIFRGGGNETRTTSPRMSVRVCVCKTPWNRLGNLKKIIIIKHSKITILLNYTRDWLTSEMPFVSIIVIILLWVYIIYIIMYTLSDFIHCTRHARHICEFALSTNTTTIRLTILG